MVMNKKEREERTALIKQALMAEHETRKAKALGWSTHHAPELVYVPDAFDAYVEGWRYNVHNYSVVKGWSRRASHGIGHPGLDGSRGSGSQKSCPVYATEREAWIALRLAVEKVCAEKLARIDEQIDATS